MPALNIILDGDGAWPDLADRADFTYLQEQGELSIALLKGGMQSGRSAVCIRIDWRPEGDKPETVIVETSLSLFLGAAIAFAAKEGVEIADRLEKIL